MKQVLDFGSVQRMQCIETGPHTDKYAQYAAPEQPLSHGIVHTVLPEKLTHFE